MTTPEERARAIITSHTETMAALRYASMEDVRLEGTKAMFTLEGSITQAIRQAENSKLEEVARLCERLETHFDTLPQPEAALISGALDELSNRLRSLKSKD